MVFSLLTRRRLIDARQVGEPTLLALGLTAAAFVALLGICLAAIIFLPAFGYVWWTFTAAATLLAGLLASLRWPGAPVTTRQRWLRCIFTTGRLLLMVMLACWLGLFIWLAACPGGPAPPPKADPAMIRVVTWNIHCGQLDGLPWDRFDWPARQHALKAALDEARPDILCVQEARPGQVEFLKRALSDHDCVGTGRDDGEHCAIYFNHDRFEELAGGTFRLDSSSEMGITRICTWVRLRERAGGRTVRIYNTHLYLMEGPRLPAVRQILAHIGADGDPTDAVLLTADFNTAPDTPSRRLFVDSGLRDSAGLAGKPGGERTFHLYGIGVSCLDGILLSPHWGVHNHLILSVKPGNIFPSDHFAILADLKL